MTLPKKLEIAVQDALKLIHEHSQHEYLPADRKRFGDILFELDTPLAWQWLAVLSAKHVLHLYVEPDYPASYYEKIKEFPPDEWRQVQERMRLDEPKEAVRLAEQVLLGEFDAKYAHLIASETQYYIGYYRRYQPVPAYFAEMASNRALTEASSPRYSPFYRYFEQHMNPYSNLDWTRKRNGDTAAYAFIAQCCVVSDDQPDHQLENAREYDIWINNPIIDPQKSLEFWQWWLDDALREAWQRAARPQD